MHTIRAFSGPKKITQIDAKCGCETCLTFHNCPKNPRYECYNIGKFFSRFFRFSWFFDGFITVWGSPLRGASTALYFGCRPLGGAEHSFGRGSPLERANSLVRLLFWKAVWGRPYCIGGSGAGPPKIFSGLPDRN